jgi:hypothetical protein
MRFESGGAKRVRYDLRIGRRRVGPMRWAGPNRVPALSELSRFRFGFCTIQIHRFAGMGE